MFLNFFLNIGLYILEKYTQKEKYYISKKSKYLLVSFLETVYVWELAKVLFRKTMYHFKPPGKFL